MNHKGSKLPAIKSQIYENMFKWMLSTLLLLHILIRHAHQCTITTKKELCSEVKLVLCMKTLHCCEDKASSVQPQVQLKPKTSCLRLEKGGRWSCSACHGLKATAKAFHSKKGNTKCFNWRGCYSIWPSATQAYFWLFLKASEEVPKL